MNSERPSFDILTFHQADQESHLTLTRSILFGSKLNVELRIKIEGSF